MNRDPSDSDFLHKEYPKQFARDDFWKQIKRTVNGESVSETDIALIVQQIQTHLAIDSKDAVLDLGCGNGALASEFFHHVNRYVGVDFSPYLLEIAQEYFQPHDRIEYIQADIRQTERFIPAAATTTKVLVYGCIAYLTKQDVCKLLTDLRAKLPNLETILIGNVPDHQRASEFFAARNIVDFQLDDPASPIGVWWEQSEFQELGQATGFETTCVTMPPEFYGGVYRFDVVLTNT